MRMTGSPDSSAAVRAGGVCARSSEPNVREGWRQIVQSRSSRWPRVAHAGIRNSDAPTRGVPQQLECAQWHPLVANDVCGARRQDHSFKLVPGRSKTRRIEPSLGHGLRHCLRAVLVRAYPMLSSQQVSIRAGRVLGTHFGGDSGFGREPVSPDAARCCARWQGRCRRRSSVSRLCLRINEVGPARGLGCSAPIRPGWHDPQTCRPQGRLMQSRSSSASLCGSVLFILRKASP